MTYATQYGNWPDSTFTQRTTVAVVKAAINISSEVTSTADHANRVALAKAALASPDQWGRLFALGVIANQALNDAAALTAFTDASLDTTVASVWNAYSGVV